MKKVIITATADADDIYESVNNSIDIIEDNFDYAIDGLETLMREHKCSKEELTSMIDEMSQGINKLISQISEKLA